MDRVRRGLAALVVLLGLLGAGRAWAPTPAEDAAIARAEARGRMIYAYDQAAWVSTDAVMAKIPPADLPKTGGGWVVEPRSEMLRVTFYSLDRGAPAAMAWADVRGRTVAEVHVLSAGEDRSLTPVEQRMVAARGVAAKQGKGPCTEGPFNFVILLPETPAAPVVVYLLSPQVTTGVYPFGGHYEIDVAPGGQVAASRAFTKSCLNLDTANTRGVKGAEALFLTHLLDPTPTEIHVYLSLWTGKPIYVGTDPTRTWAVEAGRIRLVKAP